MAPYKGQKATKGSVRQGRVWRRKAKGGRGKSTSGGVLVKLRPVKIIVSDDVKPDQGKAIVSDDVQPVRGGALMQRQRETAADEVAQALPPWLQEAVDQARQKLKRRKNVLARQGSDEDEDDDEDEEDSDEGMEQGEGSEDLTEGASREETAAMKAGGRTSEGEAQSEAQTEAALAGTDDIANSNGVWKVTEWRLQLRLQLMEPGQKDPLPDRLPLLTSLGCCGLRRERQGRYVAYFGSAEEMKEALQAAAPGVGLSAVPVHRVWLTNLWHGATAAQVLDGLQAACPAASVLRLIEYSKSNLGVAEVITEDSDSAEVLLAVGVVEVAGLPCPLLSAAEFNRRCKLRVYGAYSGQEFHELLTNALKQPLRQIGLLDGWAVHGSAETVGLLLRPSQLQRVLQALAYIRCGNEVLLVRRWGEPAYGALLEKLAPGITEEDLLLLLSDVTMLRLVLLPERCVAVIYLLSAAEREKLLRLGATLLQGVCESVRSVDNHMYCLPPPDVADSAAAENAPADSGSLPARAEERPAGKEYGKEKAGAAEVKEWVRPAPPRQRFPNSKGEFALTPQALTVKTKHRLGHRFFECVEQLTALGCCGLEQASPHRYLAYFASAVNAKAALRTNMGDISLAPVALQKVWLTNLPPHVLQGQVLLTLRSACPSGIFLDVKPQRLGVAKVLAGDEDSVQALVAMRSVVVGGRSCRVLHPAEFEQQCQLRLYGVILQKHFRSHLTELLTKPLRNAGVPEGWQVCGNQITAYVVLGPLHLQAGLKALANCAPSDQVLMARRWNEPVFGLLLENLPVDVTEEDISQLLADVAPVWVEPLPKFSVVVVYLSSAEEREKLLLLNNKHIKGKPLHVRIIDRHIHNLLDDPRLCALWEEVKLKAKRGDETDERGLNNFGVLGRDGGSFGVKIECGTDMGMASFGFERI